MILNVVTIKNLLQHLVDISPYRLYDNDENKKVGKSLEDVLFGEIHIRNATVSITD